MATISTDTTLASLSYSSGETIDITDGAVLTIDSTPTVTPGHLRCILSAPTLTGSGTLEIRNDGTTLADDPLIVTLSANSKDFRFEINSTFRIRGQMIDLAAGDGSANQQWAFTGNWANIPMPSYVEVETAAGSGEFMPWFVFYEEGVTNVVARTDFCGSGFKAGNVLFWSKTAKTLTSGDDVNGNKVPIGARVRVPNIFIASATTSTTNSGRTQVDVNIGGTVDWENVCFDPETTYCNLSGFTNAYLTNVGGGRVFASSSNGECRMNGISGVAEPLGAGASVVGMSVVLGPSSIERAVCCGEVTRDAATGWQVQQAFQLEYARKLWGGTFERDSSNGGPYIANLPPSADLDELVIVGQRLRGTNLAGVTIKNVEHADGFGTAQRTDAASQAAYFVNCSDVTIVGLSNAGPMACRSSVISTDAQCANINIFGLDYDGAGNTQGLVAGNAAGITIKNAILRNARSGQRAVDAPSTFLSSEYDIANCRVTSSGSVTNDPVGSAFFDFLSGTETGFQHVFAAAPNFTFANLVDPGTDPTQGTVICGPFGFGDQVTLGGGAAFDNRGGIELKSTGDSFVAKGPFEMHGILDFDTSGALRYDYFEGTDKGNTTTAPSGLSFEFALRTPSGVFPETYETLSPENLSASLAGLSGYDSNQGLRMRVRVTATSDDATRIFNQLGMRTLVDSGYAAPDATLTLRGPAGDDVTTLYLLSDDSELASFTGAGEQSAAFAAVFGQEAYFVRRNAAGVELMRTQAAPLTLSLGNLGNIDLFSGAEVQLAQASILETGVNVTEVANTPVSGPNDLKADVSNLSADVNVIQVGGIDVSGPDDLKGDGMTEASLHAALDTYGNKANWMADATTIATAVQAGILNEGDGQQVIDAIVQAIGNENIAAATIAAEVWAHGTRDITNPADLSELETKVAEIAALHGLDLANPLVLTATTRSSGSLSQTISGNGVTSGTITRTS